jgi:hypothetical protein
MAGDEQLTPALIINIVLDRTVSILYFIPTLFQESNCPNNPTTNTGSVLGYLQRLEFQRIAAQQTQVPPEDVLRFCSLLISFKY